jgi:hypothetical protein
VVYRPSAGWRYLPKKKSAANLLTNQKTKEYLMLTDLNLCVTDREIFELIVALDVDVALADYIAAFTVEEV